MKKINLKNLKNVSRKVPPLWMILISALFLTTCTENQIISILESPEIRITFGEQRISSGSDTTIELGTIYLGDNQIFDFSINNSSKVSVLELTDTPVIEEGGEEPSFFSISSPPDSVIEPGESTTFQVSFLSLSEVGEKEATVRITSNDNDEEVFQFSLKANATVILNNSDIHVRQGTTDISVGDTIDIGSVEAGSEGMIVDFSILNFGDTPVNLSSGPNYVSVSGTHTDQFSIQSQPSDWAVTYTSRKYFSILFQPSTIGEKTVDVSFVHSDSDESPYTFTITGTGADSDVTSPDVSITSTISGTTTNQSTIPITVTFTEDVTGFDSGDLVLSGGTAGSFTSVNASVYTFNITPSGDDPVTISLTVPTDATEDGAENGNNASEEFTITYDSTYVPPVTDYSVTEATYPASGTGLDTISGSFKIENQGGVNGTEDITWTVYLSDDQTFDEGTDTELDTGTETALSAGATSTAAIYFQENWPVDGGPYYLIIVLESADDGNDSNNIDVSSVISITTPIDYVVNDVLFPSGPDEAGGSVTVNFTVQNQGDIDGTENISWKLCCSPDASYSTFDTLITEGVISDGLAAGSTSDAITASGNWPDQMGGQYLIIVLSTIDSEITGNNETVSDEITLLNGIEYSLETVVYPESAVLNSEFSGSFYIRNNGGNPGTSVTWEVFISQDSVYDAGDEPPIETNTVTNLAAGSLTTQIGYSGTWSETGSRYIIIKLAAAEDDDQTNNEAASSEFVVVEIPDYTILNASYPIIGAPGEDFADNPYVFQIKNNGTANGSETVNWAAFFSDDQIYDVGVDTQITSGSLENPLDAGVTFGPVTYSGTWPAEEGEYYILIVVSAADDLNSANDTVSSDLYDVVDAGRIVAVGDGGLIMYSDTAGETWHNATVTPSTAYPFYCVAGDGNGTWAAGTSGEQIYYSDNDGLNWQLATLTPINGNRWISTIGHRYDEVDGDHWIATTDYWGGVTRAYSTDGINWTAYDLDVTDVYTNCYDDGHDRWVVANDYTAYSIDDGESWLSGGRINAPSNKLADNGSGKIVSAGGSAFAYSTNGADSWTAAASPPDYTYMRDLVFGNSTWVAAGNWDGGSYATAAYSFNGDTWTVSAVPTDTNVNTLFAVVYEPTSGRFVAAGFNGHILVSRDNAQNFEYSLQHGTATTSQINAMAVGGWE